MSKKILVDYIGSIEVTPQQINESIKENNGKLIVSGIMQRASSSDDKNFNQRHLQIDLPEETKELISRDSELHYLIGALGYEYKKF